MNPSANTAVRALTLGVAHAALLFCLGCGCSGAAVKSTAGTQEPRSEGRTPGAEDRTPGAEDPKRTPEGKECPETGRDEAGLRGVVAYLASPELAGRVPGTEGDRLARKLIAARLECAGVEPAMAGGSYVQPFTNSEGASTANVLGVLRGSDPAVASEIIVLGAHHDHLGHGMLGANDDASGVAALLAIAERLAAGPAPRRTILFAAFGSEESQTDAPDAAAFEGSEHFAANPIPGLAVDDVVFMVNMDMLGTYSAAGTLNALGTWEGSVGRPFVEAAAAQAPDLDVTLGYDSNLSDNVSFCTRGIPYVFFWTEDTACYHKTCDTADRIEYSALEQIAEVVGSTVAAAANATADLSVSVRAGVDVCLEPKPTR